MKIASFLLDLKRQGVHVSLDGSELVVKGARQALTPEVVNLLRSQKGALVQFLAEQLGQIANQSPIPPLSPGETAPVSLVQQSYWFLHQLEDGQAATYSMPIALRLNGRLDVAALEAALNHVVQRHEALRTNFVAVDGAPRQVVRQGVRLSLERVSAGDRSPEELEALIAREARRPFRLDSELLFRATLFQLSGDEYVLLLNMHHIVADGWSLGVLVKEFGALYTSFRAGRAPALPPLPVQYPAYTVWQRQRLDGGPYTRQVEFWKQTLAGLPPLLELPTDHPRPAAQSYRGDSVAIDLPRELAEKLQALSRREGVTLFVTLLAALKVLLARYSGKTDIVVGTAIANRPRPELEAMVGFFVNTLVLRDQVVAEQSFLELLAQVRDTTLAAYAHPDVPFDGIVEAVQPERSLSVPPIFQVMFRLHNQAIEPLSLPELVLEPVPVSTRTAKLDLNFSLSESASGIRGEVEYATDLFDRATIERLVGHYRVLLEAVVAIPGAAVGALPVLSAEERQRQLVDWNATAVTDPEHGRGMHERFEAVAAEHPEKEAYVFEDERLTYRELNARANRIAHGLRALGVGPEVRVGLCVDRSAWMGVGCLGILKSGGTYVPLDPAYPADRLAHMVDVAAPKIVLTESHLLERLPPSEAKVICLDRDWERFAAQPETNPSSVGHAEHSAYVLYTSGSTGKPKGILVAHKAFANMALAHAAHGLLGPERRVLQFASLSFSISLWGSFMGWLGGGTVFQVNDEQSLPGEALFALMQRERINTVTWPVSLLSTLPEVELPELTTVISSAEPCNDAVVARWSQGRRFLNMYGNSEVAIGSTIYECLHDGAPPSIGRPIANTEMYILDEHLRPCPVGVVGEICTGGAGLARGYLNRPEATAEKFIPNPFSDEPGARLYRTGDLARYRPDGSISFVGRVDFQVSVRGFRIELKEIETVLRTHPAVDEVAVNTRADHAGNERLVAYLVARDGAQLNYGELRTLLGGQLPSYMVPSVFVTLAQMPLTPNRKVDRLNLPEPDLAAELARDYAAPATATEVLVAGMWGEVLGLERVGAQHNFFEIGGHSLLATQVIARLEQHTGLKLPVRAVFEHPTVERLARYVELEQLRASLTTVVEGNLEVEEF